jgi:hypothetical protein
MYTNRGTYMQQHAKKKIVEVLWVFEKKVETTNMDITL